MRCELRRRAGVQSEVGMLTLGQLGDVVDVSSPLLDLLLQGLSLWEEGRDELVVSGDVLVFEGGCAGGGHEWRKGGSDWMYLELFCEL